MLFEFDVVFILKNNLSFASLCQRILSFKFELLFSKFYRSIERARGSEIYYEGLKVGIEKENVTEMAAIRRQQFTVCIVHTCYTCIQFGLQFQTLASTVAAAAFTII